MPFGLCANIFLWLRSISSGLGDKRNWKKIGALDDLAHAPNCKQCDQIWWNLPLWQKFKRLWKFCEGLVIIYIILSQLLQILYHLGQILIVENSKYWNVTNLSSHTACKIALKVLHGQSSSGCCRFRKIVCSSLEETYTSGASGDSLVSIDILLYRGLKFNFWCQIGHLNIYPSSHWKWNKCKGHFMFLFHKWFGLMWGY